MAASVHPSEPDRHGASVAGERFVLGCRRRAADHGPIGADEAQHAPDDNVRKAATSRECGPHLVDLPSDAVQEIGSVSAADDQPLDPRPEHTAAHLPLWSFSLVPLGIQDKDPGRPHRNMVDVGSGAWNPSIVQDQDSVANEEVEPTSESLFANRTGLPGTS